MKQTDTMQITLQFIVFMTLIAQLRNKDATQYNAMLIPNLTCQWEVINALHVTMRNKGEIFYPGGSLKWSDIIVSQTGGKGYFTKLAVSRLIMVRF